MATGRLPDPNTAPLTAKGDLYTYSTVPARLAVGSNGDTLVADSSATTGLRWQGNFAAGKNVILNSDFRLWQRGTSFTITANNAYTADRFLGDSDGTLTISRQSFTAGAAPVAGYESPFFLRVVKSGGTYASLVQRIEDVRTFAGQTVTFSFWAKCSTGTVSWQPVIVQNFGSGGSASVDTYASSITVNTTWTRYTVTVSVPSISGKTIGTNSFLSAVVWTAGSGTPTVDFWGVQLEAGNTATAFQTATGTLAGELAACQRYYWRNTTGTTFGVVGTGMSYAATNTYIILTYPVTMRTTPASVDFGNLRVTDLVNYGLAVTAVTLSATESDSYMAKVQADHATGATVNRPAFLAANNNTAAFIGLSAEL